MQQTSILTAYHPEPTLPAFVLMGYALTSYAIGVAGLGVLILAMGGLLPLGHFFSDSLRVTNSVISAVTINFLLTLLFGVQHSVMARPFFKRALAKLLPASLERATYVAASGIVTLVVVLCWQPIEGVLWATEGAASYVLWIGYAFGWTYLLASTFAINHWDLFGLRQAWLAATRQEYTTPVFSEKYMYAFSRHPIMAGVLIGMWSVPVLGGSQFVLALMLTGYMAVGLMFEERDLVKNLGQQYLDYKKRVGLFFTLKR